jgi:hypothetical protein
MDPHVTREILWNIPPAFVGFLYEFPPLKVHTKVIQALSRADGRWYFLPVVELPSF